MTRKTTFAIIILAVAAAVVLVLLWMRRGSSGSADDAGYNRMQSPEYARIMEFERGEQRRTMGELARSRQNLDEAREAGLDPEVVKELEDAVAAGERQLELERERMRANLRREIWMEEHPERVKAIDAYRAKEAEIMAQIDDVHKRIDAAKAAGAPADELAALEGEAKALMQKLAENHAASVEALRNLNNK